MDLQNIFNKLKGLQGNEINELLNKISTLPSISENITYNDLYIYPVNKLSSIEVNFNIGIEDKIKIHKSIKKLNNQFNEYQLSQFIMQYMPKIRPYILSKLNYINLCSLIDKSCYKQYISIDVLNKSIQNLNTKIRSELYLGNINNIVSKYMIDITNKYNHKYCFCIDLFKSKLNSTIIDSLFENPCVVIGDNIINYCANNNTQQDIPNIIIDLYTLNQTTFDIKNIFMDKFELCCSTNLQCKEYIYFTHKNFVFRLSLTKYNSIEQIVITNSLGTIINNNKILCTPTYHKKIMLAENIEFKCYELPMTFAKNKPAKISIRYSAKCDSVFKKCYICQKNILDYSDYIENYSALCMDCGIKNYTKQKDTVDLTDKICIVTGGRSKIGYMTSLQLLRFGATVVATTRFPVNALLKYQKEKDYESWKD
jgi:hypothetical protein